MAEENDAFYVHPYSSGGRAFDVNSSLRSFQMQAAIQFDASKVAGSSLLSTNSQRHQAAGGSQVESSTCLSCLLHFDGAAKGNPGLAGAGAVLRAEDGSKSSKGTKILEGEEGWGLISPLYLSPQWEK
ncbi:Ribonuclease H-like superfamily [Sesbania bispinosa]|nr:Ribonuclease H-like superfamily [Sesbania bispinosa]